MTTVTVLLYGFGIIKFDNFIHLFVLLYGVTLLSHISYFIYLKAANISLRFNHLRKTELSKILKYGLFTLIGASGTQIVLQIDSLMVAGIKGLDATGIYTIAFFIGTIIEIPKRSITQITTPLMAQAFEKGNMKEVAQYYKQTSINQLVIGGLLLLGVWANLDSIYMIMPNSEVYEAGFNVVLLIGLGKLTDMLFGVNGEIIVLSKYYKFNVVTVAILAISIIIGNLILIPTYGIEGAAAASLAAMLLFNMIKFCFVFVKFKIQPFSFNTLKFFGIIGVVILLNLAIPRIDNVYIDVVMRSFSITSAFLLLTYFMKVSPEINDILNKVLKG
jgi:O-antigen/teichoic acid export membrane protein